MKIFLVILFLLFRVHFVDAATDIGVDNAVDQKQGQSNNFSYETGDYYGSQDIPNITRLDSNVTMAPAPFLNEGWKVWSPRNRKVINIRQIEGLRNDSYSIKREVRFWADYSTESKSVTILSREFANKFVGHSDVFEIGYVKVSTRDPLVLEGLINEALYLAVKEAKIRNALVYVRGKNVTNGRVMSIGSMIGGGAPIGGGTDPSSIVVSGAAGSGIGSSQAWVDQGYEVKIVSYNKIPSYSSRKKIIASNEESVKRASSPSMPAIYFDTDEHIIKDSLAENSNVNNQNKKIENIALEIKNQWPDIMSSQDKFWFMGGADERHTEEHNSDLGRRRGKTVAAEVAKLLVHKYRINQDEVVDRVKIKYASSGEDNPESDKYKNNRVVYVVRGEIISKLNK